MTKKNVVSKRRFPERCRGYWVIGCEQGQLREAALPPVGRGQVLVETSYSAVSRGTESLVYRGLVPPPIQAEMRAPHQEGEFPWPVKYGYCSVGRVIAGPEELTDREVFCLYPHQDYYVVGADAVVPLPPGLSAKRAVLAANMETALNAIWDAQLKAGDRVSVVGAGVVGCLIAFLASRHPATQVELIDVNEKRAAVSEALGVDFSVAGSARGDSDVVFHTSATSAGLATALQLAAVEAKVVELSWYGSAEVSVPLGVQFHPRRLSIICSQVGKLPASQRPRWDYRRRMEAALKLCESPLLDVLFTSESAFSDLPKTMAQLQTPGELCHRIVYS